MAEKKEFDLAAYLGSLDLGSESGPQREQIEYIDISLLDEDEENFYATDGIEDLAANIATIGLLDPLRVRPDPDAPGRFRVVSGHRRRKALALLKEDDPEKWGAVPCIQEGNAQSPAMQELRLILANKDNRKISPNDLLEQAKRVEKLLYQLQEEQGVEFPGRMRDHVAAAVNASKSKLSRLKVISEKLHAWWKPYFKNGEISESVAYSLARTPDKWQMLMRQAWNGRENALTEEHVRNVQEKFETLSTAKCKHDHYCTCWANQARMQHIAGLGKYDHSCTGCCCECSQLISCQWNCVMSESTKKQAKIDQRISNAEKKAEAEQRIQPTVDYIRDFYSRFGKAKSVAGMDTPGYLSSCGAGPYNTPDMFDRYEVHPEKIKAENIKLPFAFNFYASDAQGLCKAAEVLGCSIDWLLGRDVPGPGEMQNGPNSGPGRNAEENGPDLRPGWERFVPAPEAWGDGAMEDPLAAGDYVVLAKWSEHGKMNPHIFAWDGQKWLYSNLDAAAAGAIVCYWMPMPEE